MGCIGPYEEGTVPRSPIHPITSLYGSITTMRSPITKIGAMSCTNSDGKVPDLLKGNKVIGQ